MKMKANKKIVLISILSSGLILLGCQNSNSPQTQESTVEHAQQNAAYWEQMAKVQAQSESYSKQLERSKKHSDRMETLLNKWEEQAARRDEILKAQEKALGIGEDTNHQR